MARYDREPICTYDQALWRLVRLEVQGFLPVTGIAPGSDGYDTNVGCDVIAASRQIVADIFWVSDEKVAHDVEKRRKTLFRPPAPVRRREVF